MKPITIQHPLTASFSEETDQTMPARTYEWRQMLGFALIGLGVLAVAIGWFGVSGEAEPWKQMPYLASGGIGGAAAIAIGVTSLISFEHASDRRVLADVLTRLTAIESELEQLRDGGITTGKPSVAQTEEVANTAPRRPARRPVRKS